MAQFHNLRISDISQETEDSVVISFEIPKELTEIFSYSQGQYLTIKHYIDGEEVRRSYSLCSSPLENKWCIGVKKVEGGRFSTFANESLQVGDVLEIMPPDGKFYTAINKEKQRNYVCFAAGSGITPILSIIKTHLSAEPNSNCKLFYINQSTSTIMFKEELEEIKDQHMERFEMFHFLTKEKRSAPLFNGRLDREKLEVIFKVLADVELIDHYFICGPESMIHLINDFLSEKEVDKSKIHFELFGTNTNQTKKEKQQIAETFKGKKCEVTIIEGGISLQFDVEQGSENVLDAALNNAADLPFACKGGVCATCKAKLLEGEVNMLLSYGLEQEEIDEGFILTCQSLPISEKLVVDYDV